METLGRRDGKLKVLQEEILSLEEKLHEFYKVNVQLANDNLMKDKTIAQLRVEKIKNAQKSVECNVDQQRSLSLKSKENLKYALEELEFDIISLLQHNAKMLEKENWSDTRKMSIGVKDSASNLTQKFQNIICKFKAAAKLKEQEIRQLEMSLSVERTLTKQLGDQLYLGSDNANNLTESSSVALWIKLKAMEKLNRKLSNKLKEMSFER